MTSIFEHFVVCGSGGVVREASNFGRASVAVVKVVREGVMMVFGSGGCVLT